MPLLDAGRVRAADRWAIDVAGMPSLELMERASQGLADLVMGVGADGRVVGGLRCGQQRRRRLCRGADAARHRPRGGGARRVPLADLKGDARVQADGLQGARRAPFDAALLDGAAVIVDALLGTGFRGELRGAVGEAVAALAAARAPVVACDVPSGVDASTGEVAGQAVRAAATATFHAAKPGLHVNPGKRHAGAVRVVDIGIPAEAAIPQADTGLLADAALLATLSERQPGWTKFTSGHVLVAGGSRGLSGAVVLAATGRCAPGPAT